LQSLVTRRVFIRVYYKLVGERKLLSVEVQPRTDTRAVMPANLFVDTGAI